MKDIKKGAITIATVIAIATPVIVAAIAGYYANTITTNDKISQTKSIVDKDISDDRQRITAVESSMNINIPAINKRLDSIDSKLDKLLNK